MSFRSSGEKGATKFVCESCDFKSDKISNYNRHLQTIKHKRSCSGKNPVKKSNENFISNYDNKNVCTNDYIHTKTKNDKNDNKNDNKSGENPALKYECKFCDFKSNKKSHYDEHLQTKKHNDKNDKLDDNKSAVHHVEYECVCGKTYKFQSSLSRHKQRCSRVKETSLVIPENNVQNISLDGDNNYASNEILGVIKTISTTTTLDGERPVVNINIVNNNNNTYNTYETNAENVTTNTGPTFSVKNYLNTECKDAYNVSDVINNFKCDILKLPKKTLPFYKCIIDKLFEMEKEKMPIRCSDTKRKTFFGKEDTWKKDYDVIEEFVKKVVNLVCDLRNQFSKCNPDWHDDDVVSVIMHAIIRNIAKIYDDVTCKHILCYLAEKTKISKG